MRDGGDGGRDVAQWARALVAQGAAPLKVAAVSPARPIPPSLHLGRWFGAGLDFELSSPLPWGARAEAAHLGLRWHSHDCPCLTADTPLEFRKVSPNGFGLLVLPPPRLVSNKVILSFAEELRILSMLIISLRFCSAFTEHSCSLLF